MKRIRVERVALVLSILAFIAEVMAYGYIKFEKDKMVVEATPSVVAYEELPKRIILDVVEKVEEVMKQEVYFTSYYQGDGSSTNRTGSGLTTDMFSINENGWYTYQGKVVVAAATLEGLASQYGVLSKFNEADAHITYYSYFDELEIEINGKEYKCVVLDTCGASMDYDYLLKVDNGINRIDIFVAEKQYSVGKVKGYIK